LLSCPGHVRFERICYRSLTLRKEATNRAESL
jgi:hypothetical protein